MMKVDPKVKFNFIVALTYFITAKIGLLLAIPPGYATAIWPASGLALFVLIRWGYSASSGIFAGHFAINLWVALGIETQSSLFIIFIKSFCIASGGLIQVCLACYLTEKFIGHHKIIANGKSIILFTILAGPLSCLCSATIGLYTLNYFAAISDEHFFYSWATWWVGDTMGVVIFTPIFLSLFGEPKKNWRPRVFDMSIPLLVVFALSVFFFLKSRDSINEDLNDKFIKKSRYLKSLIEASIEQQKRILKTCNTIHSNFGPLDRIKFKSITNDYLKKYNDLYALSWNPYIDKKAIKNFENTLKKAYGEDLFIKEKTNSGSFKKVEDRHFYVPVYLIEPYEGNQKVVSFDIASNEKRKKTIDLAITNKQACISEPINLVQANESSYGFLMLQPQFKKNDEIEGFYVSVIHIEHMIQYIMKNTGIQDYNIVLTKKGVHGKDITLYSDGLIESKQMVFEEDIAVLNSEWTLKCSPNQYFIGNNYKWMTWALLISGMLFSCLICVFLQFLSGRNAHIKSLVVERTSELTREIDMRKSVEEKLKVEKTNAETATKVKSQFLANMSHEIRTPMNGILGFSEILLESKLSEDSHKHVVMINGCAESLLILVNQILTFSKLQEGMVKLEKTSFELNEVITEVTTIIEHIPQFKEKGLALSTDIPKEKYSVRGDEYRLKQVLLNLLNNAVKFTQKGHVKIKLMAEPNSKGMTDIIIEVEDSGIGIAEDKQKSIFENFTQADVSDTRTFGGTGMGLTISRDIIELMEGQLTVKSEKGKGSIFTIKMTLPTCTKAIHNNTDTNSNKKFNGTILVAEDNLINRKVLNIALDKLGLEVDNVGNGLDAVKKIQEKEYDLVLMDIQMPVMDGIDATIKIREFNKDIPIVAITANVIGSISEECKEAGMNGFLSKPLKKELLENILGQYLNQEKA